VPEYCPDPFGEPLRDGVVESNRWDKTDKSSPVRHECRQRLKSSAAVPLWGSVEMIEWRMTERSWGNEGWHHEKGHVLTCTRIISIERMLGFPLGMGFLDGSVAC
jgi:hypothetical protein